MARDVARTGGYATLGFGEGQVPFGSVGSDVLPPADPRDRFDLGAGQLAGSLALLTEAGGVAAGGAGAALTVLGIPLAVGAEAAAAVMAAGALVNAASGVYNMATGDSSPRNSGAAGGAGEKGSTGSGSDGGPVANPSKANSPVWKGLNNYRSGIRTSGSGAGTRYYTWDPLHNEIEVFNKQGNHLGVMDPTTGEFIKPPVPGRTIDL